jgi:hypothetical protein
MKDNGVVDQNIFCIDHVINNALKYVNVHPDIEPFMRIIKDLIDISYSQVLQENEFDPEEM